MSGPFVPLKVGDWVIVRRRGHKDTSLGRIAPPSVASERARLKRPYSVWVWVGPSKRPGYQQLKAINIRNDFIWKVERRHERLFTGPKRIGQRFWSIRRAREVLGRPNYRLPTGYGRRARSGGGGGTNTNRRSGGIRKSENETCSWDVQCGTGLLCVEKDGKKTCQPRIDGCGGFFSRCAEGYSCKDKKCVKS